MIHMAIMLETAFFNQLQKRFVTKHEAVMLLGALAVRNFLFSCQNQGLRMPWLLPIKFVKKSSKKKLCVITRQLI